MTGSNLFTSRPSPQSQPESGLGVSEGHSGAPTPDEWLSSLLGLIRAQQDLFQQLKHLTDKYQETVQAGDTQALGQLLSQRQPVIDQLAQLDGRFEKYRTDWPNLYRELSHTDRRAVDAILEQNRQLLTAVIACDQQAQNQIQQAKHRIGSEMGRITRGGAAVQAYKPTPNPTNNRFTDREG